MTQDSWDKDKTQIVRSSLDDLDMPTKMRIAQAFRNSTWGPKLSVIRPQLDQARLAIINEPLSPQEESEMEAIFIEVADRHFATCE